MNNENELKRLESFVAKLLTSFQDLKEENGRLMNDLQDRDETIVNLQAQLADNDAERNVISSRVSNIIDQIEEWEINLGEEIFDETTPVNDASRQGSLFNPGSDDAAESGPEQQTGTEGYNE